MAIPSLTMQDCRPPVASNCFFNTSVSNQDDPVIMIVVELRKNHQEYLSLILMTIVRSWSPIYQLTASSSCFRNIKKSSCISYCVGVIVM